MLSPGDKVKDYEVLAPLGSGGMAMLYLARRRGVGGFSRLVTLKLVHQHLIEDEHIIKRFLDEARISAHVAHPNVVHVEEVGQCGGSYFIAMEYVHGVSLAALFACLSERRLRLRPTLCVWLAAQIAEALHATHETTGESGMPLDIVHRDVSPQNVLIAHTGHVKLIDFGIAKTDDRSGGRSVVGKLRYMSPEQLQLERADRRTDVYALGVMLWEMLAGRSLLRCQRINDERDWATRENPPSARRYSAHSPELDRVVLKAIAFDASQRYDNALQFRAELLNADPSAVKFDAPRVAKLLRSLLGDELDRRRASWPSEVAEELDVAADIITLENWSLDDLTAENVASPGPSADDDVTAENIPNAELNAEDAPEDDDEPTLNAPSFARRLAKHRGLAHAALSGSATPTQSAIATDKLLPVSSTQAKPPVAPQSFRAVAIVGACVVLGGILGKYVPPSPVQKTQRAREPTQLPAAGRSEPAPTAQIDGRVLMVSQTHQSESDDAVRDPDTAAEPARSQHTLRQAPARSANHRSSPPRAKPSSKLPAAAKAPALRATKSRTYASATRIKTLSARGAD